MMLETSEQHARLAEVYGRPDPDLALNWRAALDVGALSRDACEGGAEALGAEGESQQAIPRRPER